MKMRLTYEETWLFYIFVYKFVFLKIYGCMVNFHDIWHGSDSYQCRDEAVSDWRRAHDYAGDVCLHNYVQYFINEINVKHLLHINKKLFLNFLFVLVFHQGKKYSFFILDFIWIGYKKSVQLNSYLVFANILNFLKEKY